MENTTIPSTESGQDPVVVVVHNKIPSAAAAAESKDEDPC